MFCPSPFTNPEVIEMTSLAKLNQYHCAAKIIETDGTEGIFTAARLVGAETALAMLIMHLRRQLGSTETYPVNPSVEKLTNAVLASIT